MRTFDQLVDQLRSPDGSGFDVSATQAGIVLNRAIKRLATITRWVREERELGPSVADQDTYALPDDIVEIHDLFVGGAETQRVSVNDLFRAKAGVPVTGGPPWIIFSHRESSSGTHQFSIYPAPSATGDVLAGASMLAFCSVVPADLSGSGVPPFPDDMEDTVLHGCRAGLYRDLDENPEMGDYYEAKFEGGAEYLRRRGNSRVGSGAFRIPIRA